MRPYMILASPNCRWPIAIAHDEHEQAEALNRYRVEYPDAHFLTSEDYWNTSTREALARFPLSRVTSDFYDNQLGVLPPTENKIGPGFFVCEAVTNRVHAQFIEYAGRYYAGYADLSAGGKRWTIDDIHALEARPEEEKPTLTWYPKNS